MLLTVAYDGRRFSGFARQSVARTIAGELDGAIRSIDPKASLVRGCSRTDAGVHALAQAVSFDTEKHLTSRSWVLALSGELPEEIAVVRAAQVRAGYDPRHHARQKTYRYALLQSQVRDPFLEGRAWRISERLNQPLMRAEAEALVGQHDFAAFRGSQDQRTDTVRRIFRVEVRSSRSDPRRCSIEVIGDRFLYKMVRIIVGSLVDVGRGRLQPGAINRAIASQNRRDLGLTAPPEGLYLAHIALDDAGEEAWP